MTQEDKILLLKDLCARLPYGTICLLSDNGTSITEELKLGGLDLFMSGRWEVRPYLRPISSMTEEEREEYKKLSLIVVQNYDSVILPNMNEIDWLNANHFDYRGLIPKGLAIAVTKENNPYKE